MAELKSCPFCGDKPNMGVEFYESRGSEILLKAEVLCQKCHIGMSVIFKATEITLVPFERYTEAFANAIDRWNRRAGEQE